MTGRLAIIFASLLAAGCVMEDGTMVANVVTPQAEQGAASPMSEPDEEQQRQAAELLGTCDASVVQDRVGRQYTPALHRALLEETGAATLRPIRPGEVATMDFLSDRLTLDLDERDRITAIRCG